MSTFMAKAENVERKWYVLDAAGKPLGRTAATAAMLLRGKHKTTFTPHVDCGDFVIIVNADKAVLTGKKLTQKYYRHHTGWVGGLKEVQYKTLMAEKPEFAISGRTSRRRRSSCSSIAAESSNSARRASRNAASA